MHTSAEKLSCLVSDCCKPHQAKGYCNSHYQRLLRHGDPLAGGTSQGEPMRFIKEVALQHTGDECLAWPFGKTSDGYGNIRVEGKMAIVSRYVCELVHGAPPTPEHEAAHSCGKGHEACIAPGHLSWKTAAENAADRLQHGTHTRGERSGRAKLTEAAVREIIDLKGKEMQQETAARFGVTATTICSIHAGRVWAWISNDAEEIALS